MHAQEALVGSVEGFEDSIRKFVCHVICITYQVKLWGKMKWKMESNVDEIELQTIEEPVLFELLGLVHENAVAHWLELYGWKVNSWKC